MGSTVPTFHQLLVLAARQESLVTFKHIEQKDHNGFIDLTLYTLTSVHIQYSVLHAFPKV